MSKTLYRSGTTSCGAELSVIRRGRHLTDVVPEIYLTCCELCPALQNASREKKVNFKLLFFADVSALPRTCSDAARNAARRSVAGVRG